jgi:hypothetical protein
MKNPFTLEIVVGRRFLVNRTAELEKVKETLRGGGKLFVIGPRRFGKTSILLTAAEELRAAGDIVLDYNIEGYTGLDLLVRALVSGPPASPAVSIRRRRACGGSSARCNRRSPWTPKEISPPASASSSRSPPSKRRC